MNLPNKLTTIRVIMIPFFVLAMEIDVFGAWGRLAAAIIFVLASVTDAMDGHIARKYNLVTNFGKFMDPLADKLLVCSALICLHERIPAWIIIVIIGRELIISGFRTIAADNRVVIAASMWGKVKTVFQIITIVWLVLDINWLVQGYIIPIDIPLYDICGDILIWISLALTIISMIDYIYKNKNVLKDSTK